MNIKGIKRPLFRKKLFLSNKMYVLNKTLEEGENDLLSIAKKAHREESWAYFPESNNWVMNTLSTYEDEEIMALSFLPLDIPEYGKEKIYYHIHPDQASLNLEQELSLTKQFRYNDRLRIRFARFMNAIPSIPDINTALRHEDEFRIVSSLGIYSLKGSGIEYSIPKEKYKDIQLLSLLKNPLKDSHPVKAIKEFKDLMNKELEGFIWSDFRHHKKR